MSSLFTQIFPNESAPEAAAPSAAPRRRELRTLQRLIWLYFWLLVFEGALRKWILPGLSNPLLLVRDPVVILIYIAAGMAGVFPRTSFVTFTAGLAAITVLCSELFGDGNLLVTLYGFRTSFLHLPLIFVVPAAFARRNLDRLCLAHLILAIPMFFLVLAQFRASPDAWVNNGAGGGVGAQITVGFGKIRPPGTFSFTSGLVSFTVAAAAIAVSAQMKRTIAKPPVVWAAMLMIAGTVLVSGSRAALASVAIVLAVVTWIALQKPQLAGSFVRVILALGAAYLVLGSWSEMRTGMEIHQSRIEGGGGLKQGMFGRAFGQIGEPFSAALDSPFFGHGLGMGTNGANSFVHGQANFALGEGDWGRTVREVGPILGFLHIGLRIAILVFLAHRAFLALRDHDDPLALLLFASVMPELFYGQLGVPSQLGLTVFKASLCLTAATVRDAAPIAELVDPVDPPVVPPPLARGFRGRSAYAEQLHGEVEDPATQRFGP